MFLSKYVHNAYTYTYAYTLHGPRDGSAGGGRAGAHVRYMYLYMYMHMYMYMHYIHTWTRTFFRVSILKNLNIADIIESRHFGILTKKTRAEISRKTHRRMPRDLSYETDSGPKTKTVSRVISGVLCIGIRHRLTNLFLVININLLCKAFL